MRNLILICLAAALLGAAVVSRDDVHAGGSDRSRLDDATLLTLEGEAVRFGDVSGDGVLVVTYTGVGCPISGKYAPRLQRFSEEFGARGVRFVMVEAGPHTAREKLAQECAELGIGFTVLKDHRQELTRRLGAKTTTEVFLFDAQGALRYRGAVDDQYALGAAKPAPTRDYLARALEAVLAGRAPETTETEAPGCRLTILPAEELPEAVTWSKDIAPIVQRNCEVCHRPGQVGPFALQSYEQARNWGEMIASVVAERRMPPWNADERFDGLFANERYLAKEERAKIEQWVADGMPRGNPDEDPQPLQWTDGWRLGEPDAVFEMQRYLYGDEPLPEEGFAVPREGTVDYKHFVADTNYTEDRWIQSMEILPGAADVVHHVVVTVHEPDKGPFDPDRILEYLAVAVPGDTPSVFPDGYAKRLPAGARLVFQLHYTPNGKERLDRTRVGVVFATEPPEFEVVTDAIMNQGFVIPAGADNHEVRAEILLEEDLAILSFFPHMHTRGKDFRFVAHYPDGSTEELLFSHYDFNWQETYVYRDPKPFPAGTRIEAIGHFDNSAANPNNPAPDQSVRWGEQTWEEMFVGTFDHVLVIE